MTAPVGEIPYVTMYPETKVKRFWENLKEQRFTTTRCNSCQKLLWPPRPLCPSCYSPNLEWVDLKGSGNLYTYTEVTVTPKALAKYTPFLLGVVELDEGLLVVARLAGIQRTGLKIGMPLKVQFEESFGLPSYVFTPA